MRQYRAGIYRGSNIISINATEQTATDRQGTLPTDALERVHALQTHYGGEAPKQANSFLEVLPCSYESANTEIKTLLLFKNNQTVQHYMCSVIPSQPNLRASAKQVNMSSIYI